MKRIGVTDNNEIIVHMTPQEYYALQTLVNTAKGKALPYADIRRDEPLDEDTVSLLNAISEWVMVKDKANLLHNLARDIEIAIKRGDIQP